MNFKIYKITNKSNQKCYIGYTKFTIEERFEAHVYDATNRIFHYKIHQALRKHGIDNFKIEKIDNASLKNVIDKESFYIKKYDSFNNGYNMNEGGTGLKYHSEESKKKMSENNGMKGSARFGSLNPMYGKKHTKETKRKISEKNKGKQSRLGAILSEETKRKIGLSNKGNKGRLGQINSVLHRKRISESKKGKVSHFGTYSITFPDGHKEKVKNLSKFCREHKLFASNLSRGKTKGYFCKKI